MANALEITEFVAAFGDIAEASPWIASLAAKQRPFAERAAMADAFAAVIDEATDAERLNLLRAHPDLAGRAAIAGAVAAESRVEQSRAGLDRLTAEEFERFTALNGQYRDRFGFPFILAVRSATKEAILAAFETRISNDPAHELATAVEQVKRIVRFRIEARIED